MSGRGTHIAEAGGKVHVVVLLEVDQVEALDRIAKAHISSRSAEVRRAVFEYLDRQGGAA
jgi:predicted transcriptional regulator